MIIVPVRRLDDREYRVRWYSIPYDLRLKKDEMILVDSINGDKVGVCLCDSFKLENGPLGFIRETFGFSDELTPIVGVLHVEKFINEKEK